MKLFPISMKHKSYLVQAEDRQEAYKKMFKDIVTGKISISDVSLIMTCVDNGEDYPMRLIPSLYARDLIDYESAIATLLKVGIDLTNKEFMDTVQKDKWLWEESS